MRKCDDNDSTFFRPRDRVFCQNGKWFYQTREDDHGPLPTRQAAEVDLQRYVDEMAFFDDAADGAPGEQPNLKDPDFANFSLVDKDCPTIQRYSWRMPGNSSRAKAYLFLTLLTLLASGCQGPTQVISTDLTRVSGIYLIAYVDRADVRRRLEDQFVAELARRDLRAVPSYPDLTEIKRASVADMVAAANSHNVAAIIVVNRVAADGSGGIIDSELRILPADLAAYHASVRDEADDYPASAPIYAEANGFLVDGRKTRRFWTGTSWTLAGDDQAVIEDVAGTIAAELDRVQAEFRNYSRPIQ